MRELLKLWDEELERLPGETDEEYECRADEVFADPELQALALLALAAPEDAQSGGEALPEARSDAAGVGETGESGAQPTPRGSSKKAWWRFW